MVTLLATDVNKINVNGHWGETNTKKIMHRPNDKVRVLYDALSLITRRSWTNSVVHGMESQVWAWLCRMWHALTGARYGGARGARRVADTDTSQLELPCPWPSPSTSSTVLWPRVARSHSIQISLLTSEIKYNDIIMNQIQWYNYESNTMTQLLKTYDTYFQTDLYCCTSCTYIYRHMHVACVIGAHNTFFSTL